MNRLVHAACAGDLPERIARTRCQIIEQQYPGIQPGFRFPDTNMARHNKPLINKRFLVYQKSPDGLSRLQYYYL